MTREQLEEIEQSLILRYLNLDERSSDAEVETIREQLVVVQVALMGMKRE